MFESSSLILTILNLIYFNSYFSKANSILAVELKQQLANDPKFLPTEEKKEDIKYEEAFVGIDRKELDDIVMSHENISLSCGDASIDLAAKYQDSATMNNYPTKSSDWLPPAKITEDVFYAISTYVDKNYAIYLYPRKYRMSFFAWQ